MKLIDVDVEIRNDKMRYDLAATKLNAISDKLIYIFKKNSKMKLKLKRYCFSSASGSSYRLHIGESDPTIFDIFELYEKKSIFKKRKLCEVNVNEWHNTKLKCYIDVRREYIEQAKEVAKFVKEIFNKDSVIAFADDIIPGRL